MLGQRDPGSARILLHVKEMLYQNKTNDQFIVTIVNTLHEAIKPN